MRQHLTAPLRASMTAAIALAVALSGGVSSIALAQERLSAPPAGAKDTLFQNPFIDKDEMRDTPVRHRYIHGGFKGSDLRFSFYFPDKAQYQGRFFQHVAAAPPQADDSASRGTGENNRIGFSFDSGGYLVESNMGGSTPGGPSVTAYRGSAAAAEYSRELAMKFFGGKRPYGYIYGGSGGGYRSMSAIENTDVWDGAVPYVIGSPRAMQVMVRGHDRGWRILKDKVGQIYDALDAGGSGDIYAGLTKDEADVLREATRFGYPPRTWAFTTNGSPLASNNLQGTGSAASYFTDFWTKPGYEGADPTSYAARARIQFPTRVAKLLNAAEATKAGVQLPAAPGAFVNPVGADSARSGGQGGGAGAAAPSNAPVAVELAAVPANADPKGLVLVVKSGAAAGKSIPVTAISGKVAVASGPNLAALKAGDELQLDNSDSLAQEVILRYQVPSPDYLPWDIYRDKNGIPTTPQTALQEESAIGGPGTGQNGKFKEKVIVVSTMLDEMAHPWNNDWYAKRVKEAQGADADKNFRLWLIDNALHGDSARPRDPRIVSYLGVLYQALRDVSAWAEKGVAPPASTVYKMNDAQVELPATAAERKGVQPVVSLKANGGARADVKVGQSVTLAGVIDVPPGTGKVVAAELDFDGSGTFTPAELKAVSATQATVTATRTFDKPGTYFVTLRGISQRQGDAQTLWGKVRNIGRARVVVQ